MMGEMMASDWHSFLLSSPFSCLFCASGKSRGEPLCQHIDQAACRWREMGSAAAAAECCPSEKGESARKLPGSRLAGIICLIKLD